MKDGDIYFWRWKSDERHKDCGAYRSYHCRSRIGIVKNGNLYDTYWSDFHHVLNLDDIIISYQGNINEMAEIRENEINYYKSEDIVDIRHPNSSREKIYIKLGAERNKEKILEHLIYESERANCDIYLLNKRLEEIEEQITYAEKGELNKVYL